MSQPVGKPNEDGPLRLNAGPGGPPARNTAPSISDSEIYPDAPVAEATDPESEALIGALRHAYEYHAPALASPRTCWLSSTGGSSAAFSGAQGTASLPCGTRLGDFEVTAELGRGGMGVVYRARQISLNREVALKVLPAYARCGRMAVQRFLTEARAASRLHHSNIVPIYAQGEYQGQFYYAMELIEGSSLDLLLRRDGQLLSSLRAFNADRPLAAKDGNGVAAREAGRAAWNIADWRRLAAPVAEIADALEYAHQQGVIHRDVKPHNLLLGKNDRLYLTDFGLAYLAEEPHATIDGEVMGTPAYLSPEQIRGNPAEIDRRTDVYSLGVTMYELITGRKPFRAETREQTIVDICGTEPAAPRRIAPQIPVDLETICLRAMEKAPGRRYPSAGLLAQDLRRFADGRRILSRRAGVATRAARWVRRHRTLSLVATGVLLAGFLALGWAGSARLVRQHEAQRLLERAYEQLAYSDYRCGDLVTADLDQARQLGADTRELRLIEALACLGKLDEAGAIARLQPYLTETPADVRGWYLLALAYASAGKGLEAQQTFGQAESHGPPTAADAWFFRGLAIHYTDPAAAIESYRQASALRAREHGFYPQAVLHVARARNQQLYATRSLEAFPDAVASLEQLVQHQAYAGYPHYLLSIAHRLAAEAYSGNSGTRDDSLVEQHYLQALDWARRGQSVEPSSDRPITAEAECLESMGRLDEAEQARTRAMAVANNDRFRWEAYHYRWRLRYWRGDCDGALSDLAACAGYDPQSRFYSHIYPALVLAEMGDLPAAISRVRALAEDHPQSAPDTLWAATGLRLLGQAQAATELLASRAAAGLDFSSGLVPPQTEEWVRALYAYAAEGGLTQALDDLARQVSAPWRLWGELYFHTGAMQLAEGDRPAALSAFRRAYRSFDNEQRYTYHARLICVQMDSDPAWPEWIVSQPANLTATEAAVPPTGAASPESEGDYVKP